MAEHAPRVLAIASGGGHWVQLLRLRRAWTGCVVHYATTDPGQRTLLSELLGQPGEEMAGFHLVPEANRWQKLRLVGQMLSIGLLLVRLRPDAIVTTGAAPGFFALRLGRVLGARTIWIDSIANAGELSLSGQRIGRHADLWLTQWPDLARPEGPHHRGAVL